VDKSISSIQKTARPSRKKKAPFQSDASEISSGGEDNNEPVNKKRKKRGKNSTSKSSGSKSSKKDKDKVPIDPYADVDKTIELFRYPFVHGIDNELIVRMEDYLCLGKAEYLSDVIIDFILTYIYNEKFTPEMREKVYIFPSSFYSLYSTNANFPGWSSGENAKKSALQKRYEIVEGMLDMSVNFFEKDFLVFPLFDTNHWFLSIVCYPKLTQNLLFSDGTPTNDEAKRSLRQINDPEFNLVPLKTSCMLTFDSINNNASGKSKAAKNIKSFLTSHHEKYYKDQFQLGKLASCSIAVSFFLFL
jgi:Ulp1 family protease